MTGGGNAGRRGRNWQQRLQPATLQASHGICALCQSATCPHCGKQACGGRTPPGQVDHIVPLATDRKLAEVQANLRAAHGCCNRRRGQAAQTITSRQW